MLSTYLDMIFGRQEHLVLNWAGDLSTSYEHVACSNDFLLFLYI